MFEVQVIGRMAVVSTALERDNSDMSGAKELLQLCSAWTVEWVVPWMFGIIRD